MHKTKYTIFRRAHSHCVTYIVQTVTQMAMKIKKDY